MMVDKRWENDVIARQHMLGGSSGSTLLNGPASCANAFCVVHYPRLHFGNRPKPEKRSLFCAPTDLHIGGHPAT